MPTLAENRKIRSAYIILLFVFSAIFFRSYHEYLLADFPPDKRLQTATALNFSNGKGISVAYASGEDLTKVKYEQVGLWPPGFPVTLSAIMGLGLSFWQASFILEVIAIVVLFFSLYGIFRLMEKEVLSWIPICFILYQAFTIGMYKVSFTNDLVSLSFSVCALYLLLKISQGDRRHWLFFLFGIISFMPSFYRFSFYPVSLLFPFLLVLYAVFIDKKHLIAGLLAFSITASLVGLQLFYQSTLPTGLSYLDEYHPEAFSRPYWDNLGMFVDLPVEMLTNKYLFKRSLDQIHPALYLLVSSFARVVFVLAVLGLCIKLMRDVKQCGKSFFLLPKNQFLISGLLVCFVVICFLSLLSLRYPHESAHWMPANKWTYVAEARYFNLPLLLLPLLLLIGFQDLFKIKWVKFTTTGIAAAFFTFSLLVNVYYIFKYSGNDFKENASIYYHYHQDIEDYLKGRQSSSGNEAMLFAPADDSGGFSIYASLLQIPLLRINDFEGGIEAQGPVCILLALNESQSQETKESLQNIITKHQLQPVKEFPDLQLKMYELCIP